MKTKSELLNQANEAFPHHYEATLKSDRMLPHFGTYPIVHKVEFAEGGIVVEASVNSSKNFELFGRHQPHRKGDAPLWDFSGTSLETFEIFATEFAEFFTEHFLKEHRLEATAWNALPE